ncbi:hypothetical protein JRI60_17130 [Archangium violaceum]|uniref:hypothetical protein n=1 Tax=Archangium violaceum TaxID=83451 RepID=UPI0019522C52|nr:hypothetical protein [Archangium violaceum]QRO00630.1 hypothetical protein JRI60_17130 [Archangium violaceum]
MSSFSPAGGAFRRSFSACLRFVFRVLRFLFILGLVMLPAPLTACLVVILEPVRRNLPAEVLRKKK